ncbi:aminotransferase [Eubacteriales bacterium]|nr:aminotransferase [Eubacteriales bacterium]GKH62432.1 aminotransferase [Eubacteriales bacterium]
MLNRELINKEFAFLNDVVYLDTSKVCLPPMRVQTAWKDYIEGFVNVYALNYPTYFQDKVDKAKAELSKLLKVGADEVAFTHSASDSMTLLAQSFPFESGDNVIITGEEHASNTVPWLALKRKGVNVKVVESVGGFVDADDIIAAMDEKTKLISTASAFFCTGYKIDFVKIGAECKKRGIVYAIDATQSLGLTPVYPKEMNIDYIGAGAHKALYGVKSVGLAYCSNELAERLLPHTGSLQGVLNAGRPCSLRDYDDIEWHKGAARLESGNPPFGLIEALGNGISLINELGIENIEEEVLRLDAILKPKIEATGLKMISPPEGHRYGMYVVYYPQKADPKQVEKILWDNKVRAAVRYDYVRLTLGVTNTEEQLDIVEKAFREIAAFGQ